MLSKIQLRRGSASDWTTANPVLSSGEIGVELGTPNKIKIGDGTSTWTQLPYGGGASFDQLLNSTNDVAFNSVNINGGMTQINADGSAVFGTANPFGGSQIDQSGNFICGGNAGFQSNQYSGGFGQGAQIDVYGNFGFGSGFGAGNEWLVYGPTWTGFRVSAFRNNPDQSAAFVVNPFLGAGAAFTANNTLDDGSGNAGISGSISFASGTAGFDSLGNLHATNFTGGGGGVTQQQAIALAIALG